MASEKRKPDIADFFRPFAKSKPTASIPAKRPSPTPSNELDGSARYVAKQQKRSLPKTPSTASRIKNVVCSPYKSPFGPRSGASVTIPIRSPSFDLSQRSTKNLLAGSSAPGAGRLFASTPKQKDEEEKPLSFADIPTSGQTVVKDGKVVAVKSSDDEDSDSLSSLDDILGRNRRDVPTESSSPPDVDDEDLEAQRAQTLHIFSNGRSTALVGRVKLRELTSKANGINFDISRLVEDHFDDEEVEANVTKAKQGYQASEEQERLKKQNTIDRNLLTSVVGNQESGDNFQRLLNAVERTEALTTEHTWSMFRSSPFLEESVSTPPFPKSAIEPHSWCDCLTEAFSRNRAFLSGYVAEKASQGTIPGEVLTWTFSSIVAEGREDLRIAYVQTVQKASQRWISTNLTASMVEETFCRLGAEPTVAECAGSIDPEVRLPVEHNATRKARLLSVLTVLSSVASGMPAKPLRKFVALLMRVSLDAHLMADSRVRVTVGDIISRLLDDEKLSLLVGQYILKDVGVRVKGSLLQSHVLKHILPASPFAATLRIRLAQIFLFGPSDENTIVSDLSNLEINLQQLSTHLHDQRYNTSRSNRKDAAFDYGTLLSLVYILDAAIANGGRPSTFPDSSGERDFNQKVDVLADGLKSIINSIPDTGASHMRRTEAKEALNALHFRLLYAVRTKPRPKKSAFGGRDGADYRAEERSAGMMQSFLGKRKEKRELKERAEVAAHEKVHGSLSQKSESEGLIRKQLGLES
jgi:hypothetical protein